MNQYPHDRLVDERTYIQGLPQSNNVVPNVFVGPNLPPTLPGVVAADIRARFQNGIDRTPIHTVAYNALSDNFFNNAYFTDVVYYAVNLAGVIMSTQGASLQEAVNKATSYVATGFIGQVLIAHQHLINQLNPQLVNELETARQRLVNVIIPDVNDYVERARNGSFNQAPTGGGMGAGYAGGRGGNSPYRQPASTTPPASNAYHQVAQQLSGPRTTGVGNVSPSISGGSHVHSGATQHFERVHLQAPPGTSSTALASDLAHTPSEMDALPTNPRDVELDRDDIPGKPEDIIVDPYYFRPDYLEVDDERPWDVIYVPGGITLVPAHLYPSDRISKNDVAQYPVTMEPERYCRYHLIWPDGFTQDFPVAWNQEMDYLKHELNDQLRGVHTPSNGKVTTASRMRQQTFLLPKTGPEIDELRQEDISEDELLEYPRLLSTTIIASSQMEMEEFATQAMIDEFDLDLADDRIPSIIYLSEQVYPLDVSAECQDMLFILLTSDTLVNFAGGLLNLLQDGLLPIRYYRLLNHRFTDAVNAALKDNLSVDDLSIDHFVNDIAELMSVLSTQDAYEGMAEILTGKTAKIIERAMTLRQSEGEDEGSEFMVVDQWINYHTGFSITALSDLNLNREPQLIQRSTSPTLATLVEKFVESVKKTRQLPGRLVFITEEGCRLEILAGWLGLKNFLIKRLD